MTPDSTSPVPAVARRDEPDVTRKAWPSGAATAVVEPFKRTIAPRSRARDRAAAMRSPPGRLSPPDVVAASRAYSPSCGVSTAVDLAPRQHLASLLEWAERPQPVGVDYHRDLGFGDEATHRRYYARL